MPIGVVTGSYAVVQDIHDTIRGILNDAAADVYSDAIAPGQVYLLPHVNRAYRRFQRDLAARGCSQTRATVIITLPAGGTEINDDGAAPNASLPTDFVFPLSLRERAAGVTTDQWGPMCDSGDKLPTVAQDGLLRYWIFESDRLQFVGAIADRDIELKYTKALPSLGSHKNDQGVLDDILRIRDGVDAVANLAAYYAVRSRGVQGYSTDLEAEYEKELNLWIAENFRRFQRAPVRRRAYGARRRVY